MKPVIRHFNKSGKSKASLKDAGAGQGENGTDVRIHALASIGKARFATHFMAVDTVEPALNPIRELVVQGVVKFKVCYCRSVSTLQLTLNFHRIQICRNCAKTHIHLRFWSSPRTYYDTRSSSDRLLKLSGLWRQLQ